MLNDAIRNFLEQALEGAETRTDLGNLVEGYALCARSEGLSENTVSLAQRAVSYFRRFLTGTGLPTDVRYIGVSEIRSFILHLRQAQRFASHPLIKSHDQRLAGHTVNCYLRSIRSFWGWLLREGFVDSNPFDKIRIPRPPKKVITPFTQEQIQSLLKVIDISTTAGLRDYAMVLAFLDTGMRLGELIGLKLSDIDFRNRMLKVFGKGAKERRLPIGKRLLAALWKYKLSRPKPAMAVSDNFFLTQNGRPLTKNRVETIVKNLGKKAGLQGVRCSPHTFRHTFCIQFLRNGANLFTLQQMTGHSSLEVLRGYVALAESDLRTAHERFSPVDNLDLKKPPLRFRGNSRGQSM